MGNDILSRVIAGARTSLWIGLVITGIAALIGVPLGIFAGYVGGRTREVIMRITDIFLSVPGLALALAIVPSLGPGIGNCVIALSLVWWPGRSDERRVGNECVVRVDLGGRGIIIKKTTKT